MDWLKKFRLAIGNIRLNENSQSEKKTDCREILGLVTTIKDSEVNIQLTPGHYPVKQIARPIPLHLQETVAKKSKN